jgi:hypothetical protein
MVGLAPGNPAQNCVGMHPYSPCIPLGGCALIGLAGCRRSALPLASIEK